MFRFISSFWKTNLQTHLVLAIESDEQFVWSAQILNILIMSYFNSTAYPFPHMFWRAHYPTNCRWAKVFGQRWFVVYFKHDGIMWKYELQVLLFVIRMR